MGDKRTTQQKKNINYFSITIKLVDTMETFPMAKAYNEMKIKELRKEAEFMTGIPYSLQRLSYLDKGELLENSDLKANDVVHGALLKMRLWNTWKELIEAAALADIDQLLRLGVTHDTSFTSPNMEWMMPLSRRAWIKQRADVALFIAAHRGHQKLCSALIDRGADVNSRTSSGRTPLHVAASQDHGFTVDLLLEKGADIDAADESGDTALTIANRFGNKNCERHLFLFRWQERAKTIRPVRKVERFAHQYFDSAFPVWLKGDAAQVYYTKITPPSEFQGSTFSAPKSVGKGYILDSEGDRDSDTSSETTSAASTITSGGEREGEGGEGQHPPDTKTSKYTGHTKGKDGGTLPAIREESGSSSHSRPTTGSAKTRQPIHESKKSKKQRKQEKVFNEWLRKKEETEKRLREDKIEQELRKKYAEEERKRLAEFEKNLALANEGFSAMDQHQEEPSRGKGPGGSSTTRGGTATTGPPPPPSRLLRKQTTANTMTPSTGAGLPGVKSAGGGGGAFPLRPQSTKLIIDSIVQRRRQELTDSTDKPAYEAWLTGSINPQQIFSQVKAADVKPKTAVV